MQDRKPAFTLLLLPLAIAIFFLVFPIWIIRPFRHQGQRELQGALMTLRYQHIVELLCAVVAAAVLFWLLRRSSTRGSRIRAIAAAVVVFLCAGLSFVNIYEVMFHPAGTPAFQIARDTKLDGDQKVLAVNARAYPIRAIAYHHIVNDTERGVPIVVTY